MPPNTHWASSRGALLARSVETERRAEVSVKLFDMPKLVGSLLDMSEPVVDHPALD